MAPHHVTHPCCIRLLHQHSQVHYHTTHNQNLPTNYYHHTHLAYLPASHYRTQAYLNLLYQVDHFDLFMRPHHSKHQSQMILFLHSGFLGISFRDERLIDNEWGRLVILSRRSHLQFEYRYKDVRLIQSTTTPTRVQATAPFYHQLIQTCYENYQKSFLSIDNSNLLWRWAMWFVSWWC